MIEFLVPSSFLVGLESSYYSCGGWQGVRRLLPTPAKLAGAVFYAGPPLSLWGLPTGLLRFDDIFYLGKSIIGRLSHSLSRMRLDCPQIFH